MVKKETVNSALTV